MEVLDEVGKKWKNLTDIDRSAIATALGGTYQRNTLMAILENWEQVSDAQEVAADSAGTSAQKYDIYLNSMQAHINELKTVWSEFLMNMADSGAVNGAIDMLSGLVTILDLLINKTPVGTMLLTALAAVLVRLAAISITKLGTQIASIAVSIAEMGGATSGIGGMFNILKGFLTGAGSAAAAASTEVAAAGAASAVAGTEAAAGAVGFGALATSLASLLIPIAAIGAAIYIIPKVFDALYESEDEMRQNIQDTEENIKSIESTIDDYNKQLESNKSRIEEINNLKGTSEWNSSLNDESDSLERQNQLLERKIELEERQAQIEKEKLAKENKKLFDKEYKESKNTAIAEESRQTKTDYDTGNEVTDYYTVTQNNSKDLSGVERAKQLVANQEVYLKAYKDNMEEFTKTGNEAAKQQAEAFETSANDNEKEIESMIQDLEEFKDTLDDPADLKMIDDMIATLETAGTTTGQTIGEILNGVGSAESSVEEMASSLSAQFKEISGMEIKPKDADSMDEWLASLSNTDLTKVQDVLLNCGDYADELSSILSHMSGADAASYLVSVYNDFYGILQDCTEAYDEFNTAVNKNYDEEVTKYGEMLDYALKSSDPSKGVKNWDAYKASLKGLGLSSEATRQDILNLQKSLKDYVGFASDGSMYVDTDKFRNKIFDLIDADQKLGDESKKLGTVNKETGEISIQNYKALASAMGIPEQAFHSLLESAKALYDISEETQFTALQNALSDVADKAKTAYDAMDKIGTGIETGEILKRDGSIEYTLSPSLDQNTQSAKEAKINIAKEIAKQKSELEAAAKESGLTLKVAPQIDYENPESESREALSQTYSWVKNVSSSMQKIVDENFNFDTSKITNIAEQVNKSLGDGKVTVEGDTIKFDGDDAKQKFIQQIEHTFSGIDVGSIINNAIASGMTFTTGSISGSGVFKGITDSVGNDVATSIENATSGKEVQMKVSIEDNASESLGAIGDAAGDMKKALQDASNVSLAGTSSNIQNCGNVASDAQSSVSRLASALNSLPKEKSVTLTYSYHENGKPPMLSLPGFSANGRDMPAYAQGKDPQMGKPIRTVSNANSLVGEEGKERVITASGKQYDVGVNGAELVHLHKGDTVLPANVTKLLDEGKLEQHAYDTTPSRGGSVGSSGTWHGGSGKRTIGGFTSKYDGTSSSNKSSKSSSKSSGGSSSGSSSSGSSSSSSSSSGTNEAAENELKALEHQRKMEYITEKQYAQKYEAIWKKYYKDKKEYQDKDYEMQEKLHDLQKTFFEDSISMLEEENDKLQRNAGTEQKQIANYQQMQQLYHDRAEQYRKQGFTDDSPEIRELSKSWWDMYDKINDLRTQMFDNYINDFDHTIDLIDSRMDRIDDYVIRVTKDSAMTFDELEKDLGNYLDNKISLYKQKAIAINAQLVAVNTELNRLYKEGYEKNKENIQKLEKQAEELKNNVHDIAESIRQENLDNIQHELDYQEKLRSAVKQYAQDQVDKIQDQIDKLEEENDALDKQKEKKKLLEALDSSKQKNKRVYYADKGWVWEADQQKIEEAQKAYDDFVKQEKIDALQKEIDHWNDYIKKVEDSSDIYEREINAQVAKAKWGENWQEQINKDMVDNLDKTVYQACGKLDELIKKYDELYTKQTEWNNKLNSDIIKDYNLDNSNINDLVIDPNTGLKYNKNTDYQAEINALKNEIARQEKEMGTHDSSLDKQIENLNSIRNYKSHSTGAKYGYQAVGSGGKTYTINSDKGKNFVTNAKAGETLTGSDGSTWTKNNDGSVTIKRGNDTFSMGAISQASKNNASSGSSSSSSHNSSSGKSNKTTISKDTATKVSGVTAGIAGAIISAIVSGGKKKTTSKTTKSKSKSYATGGVNDETGFAALHGERQKSEVIFNAEDAKKLWNWIHNMDENCNIEDIGSAAKSLMSKINTANTDNSTDIHIEHLELPSVKDKDSFVKQLKMISLNR